MDVQERMFSRFGNFPMPRWLEPEPQRDCKSYLLETRKPVRYATWVKNKRKRKNADPQT